MVICLTLGEYFGLTNSKKLAVCLICALMIGCSAISLSGCQSASETGETDAVSDIGASDDSKAVFSPSLTSFAVIRGDMSSDTVTRAAVKLRKAIEDSFETSVKINTDWEKNETYEYELIVGSTEREKLWNVTLDTKSVGEKGFLVYENDGKVFIAGGSDEGTVAGVDWFIDNIVSGMLVYFELERGFLFTKEQEYDVPKLCISGSDSAAYPIYCPTSETDAAGLLQSALYSKTGVWHEIYSSDDESGYGRGFIISDEAPEYGGVIDVSVRDGSLVFQSSSVNYKLYGCVQSFLGEYLDGAFGSINFPDGFEYCELGDNVIIGY